jgi:WD40 repeat protein
MRPDRACIRLLVAQGVFGGPPNPENEPDYRVLSASTDGTMRVWDAYDMSCSRVMPQEFSEISAMAFHEVKDVMLTGECFFNLSVECVLFKFE